MSGLTDRLRQVAGQATPGPWEPRQYGVYGDTHGVHATGHHGIATTGTDDGTTGAKADAVHIATFDPVLVEAMLDVIDAAEALVDAPRGSPNGEGLGRAKVRDRLARFREVAG